MAAAVRWRAAPWRGQVRPESKRQHILWLRAAKQVLLSAVSAQPWRGDGGVNSSRYAGSSIPAAARFAAPVLRRSRSAVCVTARYSSSLDGRVRLHSLENLYVRARAARPPHPPPHPLPQSPQLPPSAPPSSEATRWPPHEQPRLRLHSSYPATTPLGSLCPHQLSTTELHTLYLYTYPLMQTLNSLLFRHYILHCGATCSRRKRRASAAWCAFVYLFP